MARQVIVSTKSPSQRRRRRVGEVAGVGTAECAAVCCCFPCAVINLMVIAMYEVPTVLYKKAMQKKARHCLLKETKNKKNDVVLLQPQSPSSVATMSVVADFTEEETETVALEKEMWTRFAGTGFWRSESQRQP